MAFNTGDFLLGLSRPGLVQQNRQLEQARMDERRRYEQEQIAKQQEARLKRFDSMAQVVRTADPGSREALMPIMYKYGQSIGIPQDRVDLWTTPEGLGPMVVEGIDEQGRSVERAINPSVGDQWRVPESSPQVEVNMYGSEEAIPPKDAARITDASGNHPYPGMTWKDIRNENSLNPNKWRIESEALPEGAQDNFSQAFDALYALEQMEAGLKQTGRIQGPISKLQVMLGFNEQAIDFETARNNMKLAAQALIKGIPSNFDVKTVINTLAAMTLSEPENRSRLKFSKQLLKNLVIRTAAFHKYTGKRIPPEIINEAVRWGINIKNVKQWDGEGDPLDGVITEDMKEQMKGFTADAGIQVNSIEEAMSLPQGTRFIDPNGVERIR